MGDPQKLCALCIKNKELNVHVVMCLCSHSCHRRAVVCDVAGQVRHKETHDLLFTLVILLSMKVMNDVAS